MAVKWRKFLKGGSGVALGVLVAAVLAGCTLSLPWKTEAKGEEPAAKPNLTLEAQADLFVSRMSDSQKIGQLMMVGLPGDTLDADGRYMLTEFPNGNVIFFDRNMKNPEQVKKLSADVQKEVKASTGLPAFIAVDQEGGQVRRMEAYMPAMPSAAVLGQQSPEAAYHWAVETGKALKEMGININFAPVVDLDGAYERSYGKTPETVIPYAKAAIRGYTESGVMTSLKHFPGIGKVKTDPHLDGDVVSLSRQELDQQDGKPFKDIIAGMDSEKTFVMVSNVTFPALDAKVPACLSRAIMKDILRDAYGYKGLVLTDDMDMGAMAKHYPFSEMGVRAIEAGADIVLVCQDAAHAQQVYNGLLKAYRNGTLDHRMVDEKVKRIVLVKWKNLEGKS